MVLIIILLSGIIVFHIWNLVTLRRIRKEQSIQQPLSDPKYYELKSKQEFLLAVFTVFVATAAFIGINSINSIEDNIRKDIDGRLSDSQTKLDGLAGVVRSTDSTIEAFSEKFSNYEKLLQYLENKQNEIKQTTSLSEEQAEKILKRIQELNNKNILKQESYIVKDIFYDEEKIDKMTSLQTFYFKDLKTILGDRLPSFGKPPFIQVVSNEGASVNIVNVTTESFQLGVFSYVTTGIKANEIVKYKGKFYAIVSEVP